MCKALDDVVVPLLPTNSNWLEESPFKIFCDVIDGEFAVSLNHSISPVHDSQETHKKLLLYEFARLGYAAQHLRSYLKDRDCKHLSTAATQIGHPDWSTRSDRELSALVLCRLLGAVSTATLDPLLLDEGLRATTPELKLSALVSLCDCINQLSRLSFGSLREPYQFARDRFIASAVRTGLALSLHGILARDFISALNSSPHASMVVGREMVQFAATLPDDSPRAYALATTGATLVLNGLTLSPSGYLPHFPEVKSVLLDKEGQFLLALTQLTNGFDDHYLSQTAIAIQEKLSIFPY